MNERNYQAIFVSDLDGTLLRDDQTVSDEDLHALRKLPEHGVLRAIATGRSLHSARTCLPPDFPLDYLIISTGNQIVRWPDGAVLHTAHLTYPHIKKTHDLLADMGVNFMIHDDFPDTHHFSYRRGRTANPDFERRLSRNADYGRKQTVLPQRASQFLAIFDSGQDEVVDSIAATIPELSVIRATSPLDNSSVWVEIFAQGVSKGAAIDALLRRYDLSKDRSAAIGNDYNDLEMLEHVEQPYVVSGAFLPHDPRYTTTPDNNSNAVSFAVSHFLKTLSRT
jgi:Cof subfamily protein (haloacid dehalogenase superfamily)